MRVLLSGATGLIGMAVGKELVRRGHHVRVLVRQPDKARLSLPYPCEIVAWSDTTAPLPDGSLDGIDGVIHLAGESVASGRWTEKRKQRVRATRVEGTQRLVDAILALPQAARPSVFVQGSAVGYYGDRGDRIIDEDAPVGSDFLASVCREWEGATTPLRKNGIRVPVVRTGLVLARSGGALAEMLPVFTAGIGGRLGSGRQWMSWIHLDDIVGIFVFALENANVNGPLNGVAPSPVTNAEFTRELATVLGRSVFLPVPSFGLRLLFGEMADVLLGGVRASAARAQSLGYRFHFSSLTSALQDLLSVRRDGVQERLQEQWVSKSPEEIFPFFCDERNLEALTPPFLNFHVIGKSTPEIQEGTVIDYRLRLHGISIKWRSRIEEWQPGRRFVDTQLKGPYQLWHHTHEFENLGGGTLIRDRILYRVPLGRLGAYVAGRKVSNDVEQIFTYRRKKIGELFG